MFVSLGMVLAITVPGSDQNDSKKVLNLDNSALFTDNLSLFYAQFGDISVNDTTLMLSLSVSSSVKHFTDIKSMINLGIGGIESWCKEYA